MFDERSLLLRRPTEANLFQLSIQAKAQLVKGKWGRRVFGTVTTEGEWTRFYLEIEFGRTTWYRKHVEKTAKLERIPELYGIILDEMTKQLAEIVDRHK
jgi:hypothetical protein